MEDIIPQKQCSRCKQSYPATTEYFMTHKGKPYCHCHTCRKLDKKESHERNRDHNNARTQKWVDENREYVREKNRNYEASHREEAKARAKKWYADNHEYALERDRKKRHANRPLMNARAKKYRDAHRPLMNMHSRHHKLLKRAGGVHTKQDLTDLYELQDGRCAYCGVPIFWHVKGDVHVDHTIPVSRGGLNTADNLALSCETCNKQKWSYTVLEWQAIRGW